jgi:hypothetical protein
MRANLNTLRSEIQDYLESRGIAVFHGIPRGGEDVAAVHWDTERHPDFRTYVAAAEAAGVRMVTLYANEFDEEVIDDALGRLEESSLSREERRGVEQRMREMRAYSGFTCQIELSFDVAPRVYVFELRTEWYEDLNDLLYRIDGGFEDTEDEDPLGGGYFSKN